MGIELKVGEWYETRDGSRCKVVADARAHGTPNATVYCMQVLYSYGGWDSYLYDGWCISTNANNPLDIVKHLPGCTGWDWVEPKWRPATIKDLIEGKPVPCRARFTSDQAWTEGVYLSSVNVHADSCVPFGINSSLRHNQQTLYPICEVLDTPAVPPSAEESEVQ